MHWGDTAGMNPPSAHIGIAPHSWLQRHMPWLGLLALMLGWSRDDSEIGFDPDELNG
jgi:hypothetical protein